MRTLIIFNHPNKNSYCGALRDAAVSGLIKANHEIDLLYLDEENFNPVMSLDDLMNWRKGISTDPQVISYQNRIKAADHLVFIFPIWWENMPALTKGFIDKVMLKNFSYIEPKPGARFVNQLTNIKCVTMITTMTMPGFAYKLWFGNAIQRVFLRGTFQKIGIKKVKWISAVSVKSVSMEKRQKWLRDVDKYFASI